MPSDPLTGLMFLFLWNSTWTYSLTKREWNCIGSGVGPSARWGCSLSYDSFRGHILLFGGQKPQEPGSGYLWDIWTYSPGNGTWRQLPPDLSPGQRVWHRMAYDERKDKVVLIGGYDSNSFLNDTWTCDVASNCWTEMRPANSPSGMVNPAFTYDSRRGTFLLYGGYTWNQTWHNFVFQPETWSYDLSKNTWTNQNSTGPPKIDEVPVGRGPALMAFDTIDDVMVLYGYDTSCVWLYHPSNRTWARIPCNAPYVRYGALVYDSKDRLMMLIGGEDLNDVDYALWTYNVTANTWTKVPVDFPSDFRLDIDVIYNDIQGVVELVDAHGAAWYYDFGAVAWKKLTQNVTGSSRSGARMAFAGTLDAIVLYGGGINVGKMYIPYCTDTWVCRHDRYLRFGNLTSEAFDTRGNSQFGAIRWNATIPPGTELAMQLRTSNTSKSLETSAFVGPDGTPGSFYDQSGQAISGVHTGSRWVQYRAHLSTSDTRLTPSLESVTITYNRIQNLTLLLPIGGENWTGLHKIMWSSRDDDRESHVFDVHLENGSSSTLLFKSLPGGTTSCFLDTDRFPNGTYRIRVVARDDGPDIPVSVNATSGNFTIFHPPPNSPPHVELLSPRNNSVIDTTFVRLSWNGSDPDGDRLNFRIRYSDGPFDQSPGKVNVTTESYFDLFGLRDNITYYWTVDADDGTNSTTDVPAGIWRFTVLLPPPPPPNLPPVITSVPTLFINLSENWSYSILAWDPDGDILLLSLLEGPEGMTQNSSGWQLDWTPRDNQTGTHQVAFRVSDGQGGFDEQRFNLTVAAPIPPVPPGCSITFPAGGAWIRGKIRVAGTATCGTLPLWMVQVRINGKSWMTAVGCERWSLQIDTRKMTDGTYTIDARAFDGSLYSNTTSVSVTVENHDKTSTGVLSPNNISAAVLVGVVALVCFLMFRRKKKG